MGTASPPGGQDRGQATRTEILNVARRLFSRHGFHNTGIADIQEATGLTRGAFYHHFRSKEDLALAILEAARADYAEQLVSPCCQTGSPGERVAALLDRAVELNDQPAWCNCQMMATFCAELTASDGRLREAVQDMQQQTHVFWRQLLTEARDAGELGESIDPGAGAQWIMTTMGGLMLVRKLELEQVPARELIDHLKRALLSPDIGQKPVGEARNAQDAERTRRIT